MRKKVYKYSFDSRPEAVYIARAIVEKKKMFVFWTPLLPTRVDTFAGPRQIQKLQALYKIRLMGLKREETLADNPDLPIVLPSRIKMRKARS